MDAMKYFASFVLGVLLCWAGPVRAQSLIAETPPLSPEEQQAKFHLPPGFEIQLVAAEPDVHKPMNMKFDAAGRLWVTHSLEYPFPAASDDAARDAITIFSDLAADGRARRSQRFAEQLNIPIGVLPLGDREALAWSIPNIFRLVDSDDDGVADQRSVLFGPFGVVDTHGNQNAFTRWIDGWVYANHGFSNDSRVRRAGAGEELVHFNSGNTYRFRPDGTAIEQFSWGQVNPFGLSFDPLGNLYSADCHSSAVSLLLREGYYQSFGKPHDGMGFAADITHIDHGGTGIAGVAYCALPDFPPEYRDVLLVGNVITNRVHCDHLQWTGSTPHVSQVDDFITCDDPWFRPVDLQLGPDGALYVADFYNCIIGHYEVPLDHPQRDRERGRIWRVVYTGRNPSAQPAAAEPMPNLFTLDAQQAFALLAHPNLTVRVLATNLLVDRFPDAAATAAAALLSPEQGSAVRDRAAEVPQTCHAVWVLQRTRGLSEQLAAQMLAAEQPTALRVHVVKALGEVADWQPWHYDAVQAALTAADPLVRRAAAEALAKHPALDNISPLLAALNSADPQDALLYHQTRIALRNQLRSAPSADRLLSLALPEEQRQQLVAFAATAPIGPAAILVFDEALRGHVADDVLLTALPAAARDVDPPRIDAMVEQVQRRFPGNQAQQVFAFRALADGLAERGLPLTSSLESRLTDVIRSALAGDAQLVWYNTPLPGDRASASPWTPQSRPCSDGSVHPMISSLPDNGERLGGVLSSPRFELPPQLSFWMCGHNGLPSEPDRQLNHVRLVLDDGAEVARSYPPRTDTAQRCQWDLRSHAGRRGRIEIVDGVTDIDGFAWLAAGRFEPAVIALPERPVGDASSTIADLIRLAGQLKLKSLAEDLAAAANENQNLLLRLASAEALMSLDPPRAVAPLAAILVAAEAPAASREQAAQLLGQIPQPEARHALRAALPLAPESIAVVVAAALAGDKNSAAELLQEVQAGRASAALLLEPTVAQRLKASGLPRATQRIDELTADLAPLDNRLTALIDARRTAYLAGQYDPAVGRAVFAKSVCASCHRIGDVGSTIGPALDGIGNRGLDRLLEDTLDPSRNVDAAFRTVSIVTDDGLVRSGFGLREEGANLAFHDAAGKPLRVPLAEVTERIPTTLSPMPANVIEQMPEHEYFALLAYLLSLKTN